MLRFVSSLQTDLLVLHPGPEDFIYHLIYTSGWLIRDCKTWTGCVTFKMCRAGALQDWEALADCKRQDYYIGLNCNKHHFIICASDEKHGGLVKISHCVQSRSGKRNILDFLVGFIVVIKATNELILLSMYQWVWYLHVLTLLWSSSVGLGNEKPFLPVYSHYISLGRASFFLMMWTIEPHRDQGSDAVQGL